MRVAIDAGHGYDTAGKRTYPFVKTVSHTYDGKTVTVKKGATYREHEANVGVCVYLAEALLRCGVEVFKSGWNDSNAKDDKQLGDNPSSDVVARQKLINAAKCDYCISIHFNAYDAGTGTWNTAQGCETLYHTVQSKVKDGKNFAVAINEELKGCIDGQKNRGAKGGSGWGMCNATALGVKASTICELAFMTNQNEAETIMCNPEAWKKYAEAICKGFCEYANIKYVAEVEVKEGDKVTIAKGAVYGGADRGESVPEKYTDGDVFTVNKVQTNNGQEEARLTELVSWVPVEYLTVVAKTATATTTSSPKVTYYKRYTGKSTSIVDALNSIGENSTFYNRSKIARANGIKFYVGSATQNNQLVKLIKEGKLIKP